MNTPTKQNELVERVFIALSKAAPGYVVSRSQAEAAIAECEKAQDEFTIKLTGHEVHAGPYMSTVEQANKRAEKLEAEAAALREALEYYACDGLGKCGEKRTCLSCNVR